jgi:hypothetical protein
MLLPHPGSHTAHQKGSCLQRNSESRVAAAAEALRLIFRVYKCVRSIESVLRYAGARDASSVSEIYHCPESLVQDRDGATRTVWGPSASAAARAARTESVPQSR